MRKLTLLCLILMMSFLLVGCGGECKKNTDCSSRVCHSVACEDKTCQYTPEPDCCGNTKCEKSIGENSCICKIDCGVCDGSVKDAEYLTQQCRNDVCITDVDASLVQILTETKTLSIKPLKLEVSSSFNSGFSVQKDTFDVRIKAQEMPETISELKIDKIELWADNPQGSLVKLGDKSVDKYMWDMDTYIEEDIIVSVMGLKEDTEAEYTDLELKVYYEFNLLSSGKIIEKSGVEEVSYKQDMMLIDPSVDPECPSKEGYDDNNPATTEVCNPNTDYFWEHEPVPNKCGNFICDKSENQCTCYKDCGPCEGDVGEYMEELCQSNQCKVKIKSEVVLDSSPILEEKSIVDSEVIFNYIYDKPFAVGSSNFKVEAELSTKGVKTKEVLIKRIAVLEKSTVLGQKDINKKLDSTSDVISEIIPLNLQESDKEFDKPISIKVWYRYIEIKEDADNIERDEDFSKSLGTATFIQPD